MSDEDKVEIVKKNDLKIFPTISTSSHQEVSVKGYVVPYPSSSTATFSSGRFINAFDEIKSSGEIGLRFIEVTKKDEQKEKTSKEEAIKQLNDAYKKQKLVCVFGAGISKSQKIPNWDELLEELLSKSIENADTDPQLAKTLAKTYLDMFPKNPLIIARYIRECIGKKDFDLEKEIQLLIYKQINRNPSNLFKQILNFCKTSKNSGLDSIITYNYDDLIENFCDNANPKIKYRCRYSKNTGVIGDEIPIYHVHGYLDEHKKDFLIDDDHIVLSEESYHEQYKEIYNWSNLVQLDKFMNNTCLFIGLSFQDPNLRRLLDIAYHENGKTKRHYFIGKKETEETQKKEIQKALSDNSRLMEEKIAAQITFQEFCKKLIEHINHFEEEDRKSFGVNTIWVENLDKEIPEILEKIKSS